jgi:hypothetical protein
MPDPQATLSIFAEISIALAGFSGIVMAFGRRPNTVLNKLETRRLSNLFILSGFALLLSLTWISLLHLESIDMNLLWRGGSAVVVLLATPWLVWDVVRVLRLDHTERAQANTYIFVAFYSLAVAMLSLQLANWILIAESWPFFLALVLIITGAFQQFVLLVRMGFDKVDRY